MLYLCFNYTFKLEFLHGNKMFANSYPASWFCFRSVYGFFLLIFNLFKAHLPTLQMVPSFKSIIIIHRKWNTTWEPEKCVIL